MKKKSGNLYNTIELILLILTLIILFSPILISALSGNWWYLFLFIISPLIAKMFMGITNVIFGLDRFD